MSLNNASPFQNSFIDSLVQIIHQMEPRSHEWKGASGRSYWHTVYPIHAVPAWIKPCNYIFARPSFYGTPEPLYIGESGNFQERLAHHKQLGQKLDQAIRLGATEIHIYQQAQSPQERLDIETDLRHQHRTLLNAQSTPAPVFGDEVLTAIQYLFSNPASSSPFSRARISPTVWNDFLHVLGTPRP